MTPKSPFSRVASILRASSSKNLDFPHIHALARSYIDAMFQGFPKPLVHLDHLEEALKLADEYDLPVSSFPAEIHRVFLTSAVDPKNSALCFGGLLQF